MDVISVANTSHNYRTLKDIRELILERNLMDVISVDNNSLKCTTLKFTLERNPMNVITVNNTSLKCPALKNTREFAKAPKDTLNVIVVVTIHRYK